MLAISAVQNEDAFINLYKLVYPKLYRYFYMKVQQREIAEDLVSQVFEALITDLNKYKAEKSSFQTWLFSIAKHKLIDYVRRQNKKAISISQSIETADNSIIETEKIIFTERIKTLLQQLPNSEAEIIHLKYYGELSSKEIADLLKIKPESVNSIASRAIKKLASLIGSE